MRVFSPAFVLAASGVLGTLGNRCPGKLGGAGGRSSLLHLSDVEGEWKCGISSVISTLRRMRRMLSKSGFWFGDTCFFMLIDFWGELELGDITGRCGSPW